MFCCSCDFIKSDNRLLITIEIRDNAKIVTKFITMAVAHFIDYCLMITFKLLRRKKGEHNKTKL